MATMKQVAEVHLRRSIASAQASDPFAAHVQRETLCSLTARVAHEICARLDRIIELLEGRHGSVQGEEGDELVSATSLGEEGRNTEGES